MIVLETPARRVIPLIRAQTVGAGDAAQILANLLSAVAKHERNRTADWRPLVQQEIEQVARECSSVGWDGHGANPVSQRTKENAERFVEFLPPDLPAPDPIPLANGHIGMTWDFGPGRVLTISIGESASAAYAGILGNGVRRHGVEPLGDGVAKVLVESIREAARTV